MARDLERAARKVLSGREMGQKEKVALDEIIKAYPEGVTINGVRYIDEEHSQYGAFWLFSYEEDAAKCFTAGGDLRKVAEEWLFMYEDDIGALNEDLKASPVKFKLSKKKMKNGGRYTSAELVGGKSLKEEYEGAELCINPIDLFEG